MIRLPDVSDDQLVLIIASLNSVATTTGEAEPRELAEWLLSHAYNPRVDPDIARVLALSADKRRPKHLSFERVQPPSDGEAEMKSWLDRSVNNPPL